MSVRERWRAWIGDVIAVITLLAACVSAFYVDYGGNAPLVAALTFVSAVAVPFRRRWAMPVFGVMLGLFIASTAVGAPASGVVLAVAIVVFRIAGHTSRRTTVIASAVAIGAMLVGWVIGMIVSGSIQFDPRMIQSALTIAVGAAAGDATRSRRETIESITDRAVRAEQTRESEANRRVALERLSIARDLHDAVAHQIAVISLNAGVASSSLDSRPDAARESLATIRTASREVLREIGDLLQMLRSDEESGAPDSATPQPGFERLDELFDRFRDVGLDVEVQSTADTSNLSGSVGIVAYRVIQEALTNAHKHGAGHRADVTISADSHSVKIEVVNPRSVLPAAESTGGHGLTGMHERVASVRGALTSGEVNGDFRVLAVLPIQRRDAQ